jgi:hypothetical protein
MVSYEATTHIIRELHADKVLHVWAGCTSDGYYSPYDALSPIPLSAELLTAMGFEDYGKHVAIPEIRETAHRFCLYNVIDGSSSVFVVLVECGDYKEWVFRIDHDTVYTKELVYVHQLQNLFYSIAGYELTLQTTPQP